MVAPFFFRPVPELLIFWEHQDSGLGALAPEWAGEGLSDSSLFVFQNECFFASEAPGQGSLGSLAPEWAGEGLSDSSLFVFQNECFFASEAPGRGSLGSLPDLYRKAKSLKLRNGPARACQIPLCLYIKTTVFVASQAPGRRPPGSLCELGNPVSLPPRRRASWEIQGRSRLRAVRFGNSNVTLASMRFLHFCFCGVHFANRRAQSEHFTIQCFLFCFQICFTRNT